MPQIHTRNLEGEWNHERAAKIKTLGWILFWLGMVAAAMALFAFSALTDSLFDMTLKGEESVKTPKVQVPYALVAMLGIPGLLAMATGGIMLLIQKKKEDEYAFEQEDRMP